MTLCRDGRHRIGMTTTAAGDLLELRAAQIDRVTRTLCGIAEVAALTPGSIPGWDQSALLHLQVEDLQVLYSLEPDGIVIHHLTASLQRAS